MTPTTSRDLPAVRVSQVTLAVMLFVLVLVPGRRLWRGVREWKLDGRDGLLSGLVVGEDTLYASGYSARAFGEVTVGMPREQVHSLLGAPLDSWTIDSGEVHHSAKRSWDLAERWSRSPGDTHYRQRKVFYRADRVAVIVAEFYFD